MVRGILSPLLDFDRLLDTNIGGSDASTMPMDVYRQDGVYTLVFDLPGLERDAVDLEIEAGVLTVTADRSDDKPEDVEWVMHERRSGRISRRVFLSEDLDTDGIEAVYEGGVLEVTIPVKDSVRPRRIEVGKSPKKIESASAA